MNQNEMHDANRRWWDISSPDWKKQDEEYWRECVVNPSKAFEGNSLEFINDCVGDLSGKSICVIGSGDNFAAFALAGLGAKVTSTDISQPRLDIAAQRASILGQNINFIRGDAADLSIIPDGEFDLVFSSNGFFVWISDLSAVFSEVIRVLKPGGYYIFYDIHPFMRPWKVQTVIEMEKPYFDTGPFKWTEDNQVTYEFHWMLSDIINSLVKNGLIICRIAETAARYSNYWAGRYYGYDKDQSLLDWHSNPRAGLPVWLTVASQKLPL